MLGTPGGFDEPDGIGVVAATRKRRAGVPVSPVSPVRDEGLTILKIGGGGSINHLGIAQGLAAHTGPVVVVLGANAVRGDIAASLGTPPRIVTSVSGVDSVFSDDQAIDLMMMAYSGLASGRFVSTCQQQGVNAIGLSGVDGALVRGML